MTNRAMFTVLMAIGFSRHHAIIEAFDHKIENMNKSTKTFQELRSLVFRRYSELKKPKRACDLGLGYKWY